MVLRTVLVLFYEGFGQGRSRYGAALGQSAAPLYVNCDSHAVLSLCTTIRSSFLRKLCEGVCEGWRLRLSTYHVLWGLANFAKVSKGLLRYTICTTPPSSGWVVAMAHIIKSVESGLTHIRVFWLTLSYHSYSCASTAVYGDSTAATVQLYV
eukprot:COSAG01_NODE_5067_length_4516_cov_456.515961_8_plen_152_part_00